MLYDYYTQSLFLKIGDYDIYSNTDGPVTIRGVSKLVRHTGFNMAILVRLLFANFYTSFIYYI